MPSKKTITSYGRCNTYQNKPNHLFTTYHHHIMKQKDIVLNPYTAAVGKVMHSVAFIAFAVAILLSAFFYNISLQGVLASYGFIGNGWYYTALAGCALFSIAIALSIQYLAAFLFFCWHAGKTGRAREKNPEMMPTIKRVAFWGLIALLALEFYSAFNGGGVMGKVLAPKPKGITTSIVALEQQKAEALAPLRAKLLDIEATIADEVKLKTNGSKLQKLVKQGDTWGLGEYDRIASGVQKDYDKELKAAQAAFDAENTRWNKTISNATNIDGSIAKKELADAESAEVFYGGWLKAASILSLLLGLLMEYALAANQVARHVRPLTDAEALAIEADRDAAKGSGFIAAAMGSIKGWSSQRKQEQGQRAPNSNSQGSSQSGNGLF